MEKDYVISITGRQNIEGENEEINLTTCGVYTKKGEKRYIIYDEYDKDIPQKATKSILNIEKERVVLIKGEPNRTRLVLEKGKRHQCFYATEFGAMVIGVFTDKINQNLNDDGGTLEIGYFLDVNSGITSYNDIFIEVKKRRSNINVEDSISNN